VVSVTALAAVAVLGFGGAYVLAGPDAGTPGVGAVGICHSGNGKKFELIAPDASGVLSGHAGHEYDIIPPFVAVVTEKKTTITTSYPGKNLDTLFGEPPHRFTGADLLANGCQFPSGAVTVTTVPTAVDEPGPKITSPATTTVETLTEKVVVPVTTALAPSTSTVVTVPPGETTTIVLPERTVTLPASTETTGGEHVVRPSETVTLPGTTTTETGGAKATVVTVTGPDKVVEDGERVTKDVVVTVTTPGRTMSEPVKTVPVHHEPFTGATATETVLVTRTEAATSVTLPRTTTTEARPETVSVPAKTASVPLATTVVTVPAGVTTTVTLPPRTVTVGASTKMVDGEQVFRPPVVTTLPGVTRTVTGGTAPTVATVTSPSKVVEGGDVVTERALVTVTMPGRVVRVPARVVRAEETELIVLVRAMGCPLGMAVYHGTCSHIVRGEG
jgi:hypothetical protein